MHLNVSPKHEVDRMKRIIWINIALVLYFKSFEENIMHRY